MMPRKRKPVLERVRLSDVLPLVDEYGNEICNRDYSLQVNIDYVDELARSFGPSGEPDEEVKLVRDGDVYRVKAGNSRVRAMKQLGTEECWAVIDPEDTVQSVLETVVRTNVKKKYEPAEESRFVQQLALFGDDEYVGAVARIGAESAGRLRRGAALAGERAQQVCMEQLMAAADFEDRPEYAEEILGAAEGSWRSVAGELARRKRADEAEAALRARAAELGIAVVDELPDGLRYAGRCDDADGLEAAYMAAAAGHAGVVARIVRDYAGAAANLYGEPMDGGGSAEEAERRRLADEYDAQGAALDGALAAFVAAAVSAEGATADTLRAALPGMWARAERAVLGKDCFWSAGAVEAWPACAGMGISAVDFLCWYSFARPLEFGGFGHYFAEDELASWRVATVGKMLDFVRMHEEDGFVVPEGLRDYLRGVSEKHAAAGARAEGAGE